MNVLESCTLVHITGLYNIDTEKYRCFDDLVRDSHSGMNYLDDSLVKIFYNDKMNY